MCDCVYVLSVDWGSKEAAVSTDMGAEDWTQVLWKSKKHSWLPDCLCSLHQLIFEMEDVPTQWP